MHQNPFSAARTPLGQLTTLRPPDPLVGWGGGQPVPIPLSPRRLRRLDLAAIPLLLTEIYANVHDKDKNTPHLQHENVNIRTRPTACICKGFVGGRRGTTHEGPFVVAIP